MNFFAKVEVEETFKAYELPHIIALLIMCTAIVLLVCFKSKINSSDKLKSGMRRGIAVLFILQQTAYTTWKIYVGEYALSEILPCHLCAITIWMIIYAMLSGDKRLHAIIYFTGFCGALQALLTPSMGGYNFPHFRFFEYFTSHTMIIITIVFLLVTDGISITAKTFVKSFLALQVIGVFGIIVNTLTGGNYMFLAGKPDSASVFDLLADWPYYIFQLEFIALLFMVIFTLPYAIKNKKAFWNFGKYSKK